MYKLVILGQTPAQKNQKKVTARYGQVRMYTASPVVEWQRSAALQLGGKDSFASRVRISFMFYVQDNRRRDIDNMVSTVLDALTKAEIIKDDSWQHVWLGEADATIDKEKPRAEVFIERQDEVADYKKEVD